MGGHSGIVIVHVLRRVLSAFWLYCQLYITSGPGHMTVTTKSGHVKFPCTAELLHRIMLRLTPADRNGCRWYRADAPAATQPRNWPRRSATQTSQALARLSELCTGGRCMRGTHRSPFLEVLAVLYDRSVPVAAVGLFNIHDQRHLPKRPQINYVRTES